MFAEVIKILSDAYTAVFDWFNQFIGSIPGMLQFVFAMIALAVIYRFLLAPIFTHSANFHSISGMGSDRVKPSSESKSQSYDDYMSENYWRF